MPAVKPATWEAEEARACILDGTAPPGLAIEGTLEFVGEKRLRRLPAGLQVRRLRLRDCPNLEALPAGLRVRHLEITGCPHLTALPEGLRCYELEAPASSLV